MKTAKTAIIAASALLTIAAASCRHKETASVKTAETIDVARPVVDSVVLHVTYPGYLSANLEVDLVARVNGYLTSKQYNGGDFVRKGQVLFTIEDKSYRDAVTQAESSLADARAAYAYASSQYAALKKALESDAVSQMEVLQAKSAMEEAEARIASSEAALRSARTQLGYCTVTAPFDGHVTKSTYNVGAYLAGAAAPVTLATIYDDSEVVANFSIEDSRYLSMIDDFKRSGRVDFGKIPVNFSEKLPHRYTADLSYIAPQINRETGTMELQAKMPNPYGELKSGMYATIALPYAVDSAAIMVKAASIGTDQLGKYLYVVNDSDRVVYTPVKTSETINDTMTIITDGIGPRDRYVTRALLKVRNGEQVNPHEVK